MHLDHIFILLLLLHAYAFVSYFFHSRNSLPSADFFWTVTARYRLKHELNENRRRRLSSSSRERNPTFFSTPVSLAKRGGGRVHIYLTRTHVCKYTRRCTAHKYMGQSEKLWRIVRNAKGEAQREVREKKIGVATKAPLRTAYEGSMHPSGCTALVSARAHRVCIFVCNL